MMEMMGDFEIESGGGRKGEKNNNYAKKEGRGVKLFREISHNFPKLADWAVHGWSSCLAALGAGIFKHAGILLHTSVCKKGREGESRNPLVKQRYRDGHQMHRTQQKQLLFRLKRHF